jgi:hypothetical protein
MALQIPINPYLQAAYQAGVREAMEAVLKQLLRRGENAKDLHWLAAVRENLLRTEKQNNP